MLYRNQTGTIIQYPQKRPFGFPFLSKDCRYKGSDGSLFSLSKKEQQAFLDAQHKKDLFFADEPVRERFMCRENLCRAYVSSGEVRAVIFVGRDDADDWEISYLYCEEGDSIALFQVLASALKEAAAITMLKTIKMNILDEKAKKILQSFFQDAITGTDIITAEWNYSV